MRIVVVESLVMAVVDRILHVFVAILHEVEAHLVTEIRVLEIVPKRIVVDMGKPIVDNEVVGTVQGLVIVEMVVDVAATGVYTYMQVGTIGTSAPTNVGLPESQDAVINENEISNGIANLKFRRECTS